MIPDIKTLRYETADLLFKLNKEHLEGVNTIGYLEVEKKRSSNSKEHFVLLGLEIISKTEHCDIIKLHLVTANLNFMFTYEMTLKCYSEYLEIEWLNLYTNQIMFEATGNYIKEELKSEAEREKVTAKWPSTSIDIIKLELNVKKEVFRKRGDLKNYYENGTNIKSLTIEYYGGADRILGFSETGELVLESSVFTRRINNIFTHQELNYFAKRNEDNVCYMNCIYSHYGDIECSLIMMLEGNTYLFQCGLVNLNKDIKKMLEENLKIG